MNIFANAAVMEVAADCYPYEIESSLDELCALFHYFTKVAPIDRAIEEIELGIKKPNSIVGARNFGRFSE